MSERVFVLGAGRAGRGLARALRSAGIDVVGLHGRHRDDPDDEITVGALPQSAARATTVLVTVQDAQLEPVLGEIANAPLAPDAVVLHASGSAEPRAVSLVRARGHAAGTFHPLVPLVDPSRAATAMRGAWIGIDGDLAARERSRALASALGAFTLEIPEGQKPRYHAAAVLVSNFPAVLLALGERVLAETGIEADVARQALRPLWLAAAGNVRSANIASALTGPVVRGDAATVEANLEALATDEMARAAYRLLSFALLDLVGRDGRSAVERVLEES